MKCVNHLDKYATGVCNHCGKSICSECQVEIKGETYCKACVAIKLGTEKKEERSPVLAAILSFVIAGLGQIYNGQIGKGILIFFTSWLVVPWIVGIIDAYKVAVNINQGKIAVKSRPGCLIAFALGIAIFFISLFFMALLAAIAIPNLLRARISANEASAEASLKYISTAIEAYRAANNGNYPVDENALTSPQPPYLSRSYKNVTASGYFFSEVLQPNGYRIIAKPQKCGETGGKIFAIETGGTLSSRVCKE